MQSVIEKINARYKKPAIVDVRSGDTVKVHQKIREGGKERVQVFEGVVLRVSRKASQTASITVRRIASGVGVEKTYLLHSPLVLKVVVVKRSNVRRNYLSYMRKRSGKSSRLSGVEFDSKAINAVHDEVAEAEEEKLKEKAETQHEEQAAEKEAEEEKTEAKAEAAIAAHDAVTKGETHDEKTKKSANKSDDSK